MPISVRSKIRDITIMVRGYSFKVMFQVNEYDVKCLVHMNILLFVLTKYVYICRSLTNKVKRAKGQLSPTKLNYIDDNNFKRDMVCE